MSEVPKPNLPMRKVSWIADIAPKPVSVEMWIPEGEAYPKEAARLSRKILRGEPYSFSEYSEARKSVVKIRSKSMIAGPITVSVKEIHASEKPPPESLLEIQIVAQQPSRIVNGEEERPEQYLIYNPDEDTLHCFTFNNLPVNLDQADFSQAAQLEVQTGQTITGDKERSNFYVVLLNFAGEKVKRPRF
jgi:hypothetical protein